MRNLKQNLKILLIPHKFENYDISQLEEIKSALSRAGIDSFIFKSSYNNNSIKDYLQDNSFNVVFIPNSSPAIIASSQGIPISQAIGAKIYPRIISIDKSKPN